MDKLLTKPNKWMMNVAGLLNYWYYKWEVFPFENGHLIIKGANGTGKSVTTQSFLPLLLDGNKQPSRLDPFGSRSRKMIDYIFGENPDVTEKTSYLFLEYKKEYTEEYITTGIGFKANITTDKVDSWHFVIKNKRVGKDFNLFKYQLDEKGEKVMVPLSQKELENYVDREKCGYVREKQKEYAELVNKYIFKFDTLEDYLDMVNLVVRIRTPKLSNDLGPNVIYQILERSLPELTFRDLRSLTETIQNIDLHKQRLNKTKEDYDLTVKLSNKYQDYNKTILAQRATELQSATSKMKRTHSEYRKAKKELETTMLDLEYLNREIANLKCEQETIEAKLKNLEDNDIRKAQRNLNKHQIELEDTHKENNSLTESLEMKRDRVRKIEDEKREKEDDLYGYEKKNNLILDELDELYEYVDFESHSLNRDNYLTKFQREDSTVVVNQWISLFDNHTKNLKEIAKLLNRENGLKTKLDEKEEEIIKLNEELKLSKDKIDGLQKKLDEAIGAFNQDLTDWNNTNSIFQLEKNELNEFVSVINALFEETTIEDINNLVNKYYMFKKEILVTDLARLKGKITILEEDIQFKEAELEEVKSKKEPEPSFRKEETVMVRNKLIQSGVPFVPFYEAVEFKEFVTEEERERLESALTEMGILDSLIIQKGYMSRITESDSFLRPQEVAIGVRTLDEYLDVLLPSGLEILKDEVQAILKSISIDEIEDGTFATSVGSYQNGMVTGHAVHYSSAAFIGKEARKRYRDKLLKSLESEIHVLMTEREKLINLVGEKDQSLDILDQEKNRFPSTKEVTSIQTDILNEQREELYIKNKQATIEEGISNIRSDYNETRSERVKKAENRNLRPTIEDYEQAIEYSADYLSTLNELKMNAKDFLNTQTTIAGLVEQIENLNYDLDNLRYSQRQKENEIYKLEGLISELEDFLAKEGATEIEREIREAEERRAQIPELLITKVEIKGALNEKIQPLTTDVAVKQSSIKFYEALQKVKGDIFVKELNKKFIESFDHDALSNEEDITILAQMVTEEFGEKSIQDIMKKHDALVETLNDVSIKGLEDFHPTRHKDVIEIPEISDEGIEIFAKEISDLEMLQDRMIVSLMLDGKSVSPMFIQKELKHQIEDMEAALREEDEKLYKEIIMDKIGERIRELIGKAISWKDTINKLMSERQTSSGLQLSIEWKPKEAKEIDELKTSELIGLLRKDPDTLKQSDYEKVTKHFNSKIEYAKGLYEEEESNKDKALDAVMKDVLDYRKWFEFKIYFKKGEENKKELTKNRFNALSGGERAMSMYIPLLSALFSKYSSATDEAPYIISMDEAFAGVDENNIRDMFELMGNLDLNYILNSQSLWGDYDTVDSLAIAEIIRPKNSKDVTVVHFKWDGNKLETRVEENNKIEQP